MHCVRSQSCVAFLAATLALGFLTLAGGEPSWGDEKTSLSGTSHEMNMGAMKEGAMETGKMRSPAFDRNDALKISQGAIGTGLADYRFFDTDGNPVSLAEFKGRPVAINMIYTSCAHTCPMIVESLRHAVKVADRAVGDDQLVILTVGFDTKVDTVMRMRAYKVAHGVRRPDWYFLSTDEETIKALASDLGFLYHEAPHGFDHLAQITLVDQDSRVFYQVYGQDVSIPNFVEPLKQMVFGRSASLTSLSGLMSQVKLFCTIYNPNTGRYQFDYSFIWTLIIGALCLTSVAYFLVREFVRNGE